MFFCNKFNREKTYPFFINNDTHEIGCLFKNLFMYIFYKINVLLHERHNFMQQLVIFFYIFPPFSNEHTKITLPPKQC